MASISLCMITKNEEKFLEQCLESVKGIVSEIIIVDTGSSDKTKEIAKKYTDSIFDFEWQDDFSKARNFSIEKATEGWILVLDADETINPKDSEKIQNLLENEVDAYQFIRRNYTDDAAVENWLPNDRSYPKAASFSGFFPSKLVRLFRNSKGFVFKGVVHETVDASITGKNGTIEVTDIPLHHFAYTDPASLREKRQHYYELSLKKTKDEPENCLAFFELGVEAKELGKFKEALNAFIEVLKLQKDFVPAYLEMGWIFKHNAQYKQAMHCYQKALSYNPGSAVAYFGLGMSCYFLRDFPLAIEHLQKSAALNHYNPQVFTSLGAMLEKEGRNKEAEAALLRSIELNAQNPKPFFNLAIVKEKTGNAEKAVALYLQAVLLGHTKKLEIEKKIKDLKKKLSQEMP